LKYHEVPGGDWYYIPACIANADPANPSVKWTIDPNNTVSTSRCVVPPNTDNTGPTYVDKKGQFVYGILAESNGSVDW
jgi:hypothetical protein